MDTKALRQKILDLAIRGKLVPQDPNDEPASVLLEKIRAEKQQMVKDGKLKAKDIKNDTVIFRGEDNLHYEKFQDGTVKCIEEEIPFEVPEGWEWCRLLSITTKIGAGSTPTGGKSVYSNIFGIKFIRSQNVYNDGLVLNDIVYISEEINQKKSGSIVKPKDILLNITGGSIGRCALVPNDFDTGNVNQHVMIIRLVELSLRKYLHELIISNYIQDLIFTKQVGSGRGGLSAEVLSNFLIPIPPLEEQKRILGSLDKYIFYVNKIEMDKSALTVLISSVKSKILDLAIRGNLAMQDLNNEPASVLLKRIRAEKEELIKQGKIKRDKRESIIFRDDDNSYYEQIDDSIIKLTNEELFDLPNRWEYARLKDITIKLVDGSHNPPKGEACQTEYIMASSRNINDDTIVDLNNVRYLSKEQFERENARTNISENDILLTTVATLGRSCIYQNIPPNLCLQRSVTVITPLIIIPQYLKLFFDSPHFQKLINKEATGTAQKGFYLNQLENVLIPIPPLNEQYAVTSYASKLIDQLNNIMNVVRE